MTPEQGETLTDMAEACRQSAEGYGSTHDADASALRKAQADAIYAAIKRIDRLEQRLKWSQSRFANYAKHCHDCGWRSTGSEFETYAERCTAALEGND